MNQILNCKECETLMEKIDCFPGGLCLDCYAAKPENRIIPSAEEMTKLWGGKLLN